MSLSKSIKNLKWSSPQLVQTKRGPRQVRRAWPNRGFWSLWEAHKEELKQHGITVRKKEDAWVVLHWSLPNANAQLPKINLHTKVEPLTKHELPPLPEINTDGLMEHQKKWTAEIVRSLRYNGSALDASQTGTGKTYVALVAARELGLKPLVVCPKPVKPSWIKAAEMLGVDLHGVVNWEKLRTGNTEYGTWVSKSKFRWNVPQDCLIIMDEAHVCKSRTTKNGKMMRAASGKKCIALSATIAESPLDMSNIGQMLGLFKAGDFYPWAFRHGCKKTKFGMAFVGGERAMKLIHSNIFPIRGSRKRTAEIEGFPDNSIQPMLFDFGSGNTRELRSIYQMLHEELQALSGSTSDEMAALMRARQRAELIKSCVLADLAKNYIDEGNSVCLFVSFRETAAKLMEYLQTDCVIQGGQGPERERFISDFQSDRQRVIILNYQSGGTGISLHDMNGLYPRISLLSPTYDARLMLQAFGRIYRAGAKTKAVQRIVYASDCEVEEQACRAVQSKLERIETLNDGDLMSGIPQLTQK